MEGLVQFRNLTGHANAAILSEDFDQVVQEFQYAMAGFVEDQSVAGILVLFKKLF